MKLLDIIDIKHVAGGGDLDDVSCECWQIIGIMGFLVGFKDITMDYALSQVDLACTLEEQMTAMELAKPYYTKNPI